jgi:hypothetical protein
VSVIICIGISTIYWNHGAFCSHSLGKAIGMMEKWNFGPPWRDSVLIPSSGIIARITVKKWNVVYSVWAREYWVWKAGKCLFYKKCCIYIFCRWTSDIHFLLSPLKLRTITIKWIQFYSFDSLNPPSHYARTHDSNMPEFQHSNWGEAPDLEIR